MTGKSEDLRATPEHAELQKMLNKMVNEPIQHYVEKHCELGLLSIGERFGDALSNTESSIMSIVKRSAKDAADTQKEFADWAQAAQDEASELAKSIAAGMEAIVKRQGRILALMLGLAVFNTLAIGVLLWFTHSLAS